MARVVSFYKFMITNFLKDDSPAGDLALDMKGDRDFPRFSINYERCRDHLERCAACSACFDTFEECWNRYMIWKEAGNA
jgi:uncharacterized protein YozE (UPF0346 family)